MKIEAEIMNSNQTPILALIQKDLDEWGLSKVKEGLDQGSEVILVTHKNQEGKSLQALINQVVVPDKDLSKPSSLVERLLLYLGLVSLGLSVYFLFFTKALQEFDPRIRLFFGGAVLMAFLGLTLHTLLYKKRVLGQDLVKNFHLILAPSSSFKEGDRLVVSDRVWFREDDQDMAASDQDIDLINGPFASRKTVLSFLYQE